MRCGVISCLLCRFLLAGKRVYSLSASAVPDATDISAISLAISSALGISSTAVLSGAAASAAAAAAFSFAASSNDEIVNRSRIVEEILDAIRRHKIIVLHAHAPFARHIYPRLQRAEAARLDDAVAAILEQASGRAPGRPDARRGAASNPQNRAPTEPPSSADARKTPQRPRGHDEFPRPGRPARRHMHPVDAEWAHPRRTCGTCRSTPRRAGRRDRE